MNEIQKTLLKTPDAPDVLDAFQIIDLIQGSDEWLAWRKSCIGASTGLSAANMSHRLWKEKTGKIEPSTFDNEAMARGRELESTARTMYEWREGVPMLPTCAQRGFLGASADGWNANAKRGVEVKCPSSDAIHEAHIRGDIDPKYRHQCMQSMFVFGVKSWGFVSYSPGNKQPYGFRKINWDRAYWDSVYPKLQEFWHRVEDKEWPDEEKTTRELARQISGPTAPALVTKGVPKELNVRASEIVEAATALKVVDIQTAEDATDIIKGSRSIFKKLESARKDITEPHRGYVTTVNNIFKSVTDQITESSKALNVRLDNWNREQERIKQERIRQEEEEARLRLEEERKLLAEEQRKREKAELKRRESEEAAARAEQERLDAIAAKAQAQNDAKAAQQAAEIAEQARLKAEEAREKAEAEAEESRKEAEAERRLLDDRAEEEKRQREFEAKQAIATRGMSATASTRKTWVYELEDISKVPVKYLMVDSKAINAVIKGKDGLHEIQGLRIYQESNTVVR